MALVYDRSSIVPSKIELLSAWVPGQPWLDGADASELTAVGAYRFDDPAGAVGIETHLVRTRDDRLLQVPLTYRAAPIESAALVGTTEHTVLGPRWVYDGASDPVYAAAVATAVLTGGHEAILELASGGTREPTTRVHGTGAPGSHVPAADTVTQADDAATTVIAFGGLTLVLRRVLDVPVDVGNGARLLGTWPGNDAAEVLVFAARVSGT